MEGNERNGHPRSHKMDENVEKAQSLVHSHRRLSINQAYYVEILMWLHETVHRQRPELWASDWILHHYNAPAHKALLSSSFWPINQLLR
jgi:hypothetical protein